MGFKDLFIKKDEARPVEPVKAQPLKPGAPVVVSHPAVHQPVAGGTDYTKYMETVMAKANTPEPDYYEFAQALEKKAGKGLTEPNQYMFTFDGFATLGVTSQKLVQSAQKFLDVLKAEKAEFDVELSKAREAEINQKTKRVLANEEEIKRLQQENATMNNEISVSMEKLATEENNFNFAFSNRSQTITEHISKIQTHLNDANAQ